MTDSRELRRFCFLPYSLTPLPILFLNPRCDPLRIQHLPDSAYVIPVFDSSQDDDNEQGAAPDPFLYLEPLVQTYTEIQSALRSRIHDKRDDFRQHTATLDYYQSRIMKEIRRLDMACVAWHVDEKDRGALLDAFQDLWQYTHELDYNNICRWTLGKMDGRIDVAPRFFIALPSDTDSWDDTDISTHKFRLYFICDCGWRWGMPDPLPMHMHLSNHPGYNINKPHVFFQKYGDYVLRILRMVRNGYQHVGANVPPLHTFEILWDCDPAITGSQISETAIEPLVDKAIAYLEQLSLATWFPRLELSQPESIEVEVYLDVQDGDNTQGNLHRYKTKSDSICWMCHDHASQLLNPRYLELLKQYVTGHQGDVDMQKATIRVELESASESDQFCSLLERVMHTFKISIKVNWEATRIQVITLCWRLGSTMVLEIDGITLDIHPQDHIQYMEDLILDQIFPHTELKSVTLLNYPRPQEKFIYTVNVALRLKLTPSYEHNWDGLSRELVQLVPSAEISMVTCRKLKIELAKHGFPEVHSIVLLHRGDYILLDLEQGALTDRRLRTVNGIGMFEGSFRGMTMENFKSDKQLKYPWSMGGVIIWAPAKASAVFGEEDLGRAVRINKNLQELSISVPGGDLFYWIDKYAIVVGCNSSSRSVTLTMFERTRNGQGKVCVQMTISGKDCNLAEADDTLKVEAIEVHLTSRFQADAHISAPRVDFLQWAFDHCLSPRSDYAALLLDTATRQHPSVLTLLNFDISRLSRIGIASLQNVLSRSNLEHIHIMCTKFKPMLSESVTLVLGSVQWQTLKSMALSGDNIDGWIQLWTMPIAPRLLNLYLCATESAKLQLSHLSALFLHGLIYTCPLVKLHIENIQFQDEHDWSLIIEAIDYSLLEVFTLSGKSFCRPTVISMKDVRDLLSVDCHVPVTVVPETVLPRSVAVPIDTRLWG